jgi:hypothetical protein
MISADTILRGISNLLTAMNNATMGYWQLTLDAVEGQPDKNSHSYMVVDANWRDSSDNAVKKFIEDVHIFNKYIRSSNGTLVGSELIDCTIDLSLPKRLFAQIATLGLLSKEDIAKIGAQEAKVGEPPPSGQSEDFSTKISDPNNTLAEMFGIISLSNKDGTSPDLTILAAANSNNASGTCGKTNAQLVAGTGGQGYQVADVSLNEALANTPTEQKKQFDASSNAASSATCRQCEPCLKAEEEQKISESTLVNGVPITPDSLQLFPALKFSSGAGGTVAAQLLVDVNTAFASQGLVGRVSSAHRDLNHP